MSVRGLGRFRGVIFAKDKRGNVFQVSKDDPRLKTGQLVSVNKNKTMVKDQYGNNVQVDINDPRFKTGQLVGCTKGFANFKDQNGKILYTSITDPRYLSGQLVGHHKGTIWITNGTQNKMIKKNNPIPQGWRRGRTNIKKH